MTGPTQEQMRELLSYNPATGTFHWLKRRGWVPAGARAGTLGSDGYVKINVFGWPRKAHRIAWLLVYGEWPASKIDHKNGDRADNRLVNLRLADDYQNAWNGQIHTDNRCGFKGVTYINHRNKPWQARITFKGTGKTLGYFATAKEAHACYVEAANRLFREFSPYGGKAKR